MEMFISAGLAVVLVALAALLVWLQAARPAAVRQRHLVARQRLVTELRLQQLTLAAMRQLVDEARRSR